MAEVYRRVNGRKLTKIIAIHEVVQWSLGAHRDVIAARAKAVLAGHRHDGHADIETADGAVDKYVVLSDERGLGAAMSIEFGRGPGTTSSWGPMDPVAPLRIAAGIPVPAAALKGRGPDDPKRGRRRRKR